MALKTKASPSSSAILLGCHRWNREAIVKAAHDAGLHVIVAIFDGEQLSPRIDWSGPGVDVLTYNHLDAEQAAEELADQLRKRLPPSVKIVFAADDYVALLAAKLSSILGIDSYGAIAAEASLKKHLLRKKWTEWAGERPDIFATTPYYFIENWRSEDKSSHAENIRKAFGQGKAPVIVKPNALDASIGVQETSNEGALEVAQKLDEFMRESKSAANKDGLDINLGVLIEGLIERTGKLTPCNEFSAEIMVLSGKSWVMGITEKIINRQSFVELGHVFPSPNFPESILPAINVVARLLVEELDLRNSFYHFEFIIDRDKRVVMIEGQPRPPGDRIVELISQSFGFDVMREFLMRWATGEAKMPVPTKRDTALVCFPSPQRSLF